jgi:D-alanyl-D-alanine carboxypeptidase
MNYELEMEENLNTKNDVLNYQEEPRKALFSEVDLAVAVVCLLFSVAFLVYPAISEEKSAAAAVRAAAAVSARPDPFAALSLEAKSAYVLDINSNKLIFEKNGEAQLPLASLTKIMTAVTALSVVPESTIVTIEKDDLKLEGDSGLYADERWRLADLLGLTLIESSNDGAFAAASSIGAIEANTSDKEIGRRVFVDLMNRKAKELGLSQTYFLNPTGLDENAEMAGGYGSARDVAYLFSYAVGKYPDIFRSTRYSSLKVESLNAPTHTAVNTNKDLDGVPVIIASKTGYTDLAGGNLAIVFDAGVGRPITVVVLGSTISGRFEDVKKLAWATIDALSAQESNSPPDFAWTKSRRAGK